MAGKTSLKELQSPSKVLLQRLWGLLLSPIAFALAYGVLVLVQNADKFRGSWLVVLSMTVGAAICELLRLNPFVAAAAILVPLLSPGKGEWHLTVTGLLLLPIVCFSSYFAICRGVGGSLARGWRAEGESAQSATRADATPAAGQSIPVGPQVAVAEAQLQKISTAELAERSYRARQNHLLDHVDGLDLEKMAALPLETYVQGYGKSKAIKALVDQQALHEDEFVVMNFASSLEDTAYILTNHAFYFWIKGDFSRPAAIDLDDVRSCSVKKGFIEESLIFSLRDGQSHKVSDVCFGNVLSSYIDQRNNVST